MTMFQSALSVALVLLNSLSQSAPFPKKKQTDEPLLLQTIYKNITTGFKTNSHWQTLFSHYNLNNVTSFRNLCELIKSLSTLSTRDLAT